MLRYFEYFSEKFLAMSIKRTIISILLLLFTAGPMLSQKSDDDREAIDKADQAKKEMLEKDPGLQNFFTETYGYAVLYTVGKGGLILGGAYGKGVLYKHGEPAGLTEMTQVTVGAQIGGKTYSEVIFFKTEEEYKVFMTGRFEVAAEIAALAVTAGVSATLAYSHGIAIITMPKGGFMAEVSVGGQKFSFLPFSE
ncbi:MAG: hypothetical protein D4R67_10290 [Bacteroidetes bacterium]|nr:MAG: hypothetical protein D4R67_10290 [Bacteroidota bacterium]